MSDRLLVGTRKVCSNCDGTRGNGGCRHAFSWRSDLHAACRSARRRVVCSGGTRPFRRQAATVARWRRELAGNCGPGVSQERRRWSQRSYLSCAWRRAGADQPGWLWCGTIPGRAVPVEGSRRVLVAERAAMEPPERKDWMGGGFDNAGVASICVDPRDASQSHRSFHRRGMGDRAMAARTGAPRRRGMHADYFPPPRHLRRRCRTSIGWCNAPTRRTRCGCSTTMACSARPMPRAPGRTSPRSAHRSSASRWRCIQTIPIPRGSCRA